VLSVLRDRDGLAGAIFIALGAAAFVYARRYAFGTLSDMGPGFFPAVAAGLLTFFGLATVAESFIGKSSIAVSAAAMRSVIAIIAAVGVFALLLDRVGLPASVFVASLVASTARPRFFRPANILLAASLSVLSVVVFVHLLDIPMRVLPAALQGY
jgi:hypothetical protein